MGSRMGQVRSQEGQSWPWETWAYKGEEAVRKQKEPIVGRERGVKQRGQVCQKWGTLAGAGTVCDASQVRICRCPCSFLPFSCCSWQPRWGLVIKNQTKTALSRVAQLVGLHPSKQKVASSMPGTCLCCRFIPGLGVYRRQQMDVSLASSALPPSLKNK